MRLMDKKGKLLSHGQKGIGTQLLNILFLTCSSIHLYKIEPMSFLFQFFVLLLFSGSESPKMQSKFHINKDHLTERRDVSTEL